MAMNVRLPSEADFLDPFWFPLWKKRVALPDQDTATSPPQHEKLLEKLCYWLRSFQLDYQSAIKNQ